MSAIGKGFSGIGKRHPFGPHTSDHIAFGKTMDGGDLEKGQKAHDEQQV
jgi:hypothetical protein